LRPSATAPQGECRPDADEVVVGVAVVTLVLLGHARQLVTVGEECREHVALRVDDLAQLHELPLHVIACCSAVGCGSVRIVSSSSSTTR
jgi:hypothetical protein